MSSAPLPRQFISGTSATGGSIAIAGFTPNLTTVSIGAGGLSDSLPVADGASFDSHEEERNSRCLADTRVEIQDQIQDWVKTKDGKHMLWLKGMAGTGKSTIARTVAQSFATQQKLGASFFFKKGEGDRGNASRFVTTVATDLLKCVPEMKAGIRQAVDHEPNIAKKTLKTQFDKLIVQPLSEVKVISNIQQELVVVIDALDECDQKEDIRAIIQLLAQAKDMGPISLRVFVTSRPEPPIRLSFQQMPDEAYQELVLNEVATDTIARDVRLFFENELASIREQSSLDNSWPGEQETQTLVNMAVPLFIFAATVCRFLKEDCGDPEERLSDILKYDIDAIPREDKTYLPILDPVFARQTEKEKEKFREVVGSIILLEDPLSIDSIANLLNFTMAAVRFQLNSLHSVLEIPRDKKRPVRVLHLSFHDFLVDPKKRGNSPFWIDEREAHARIAKKCLQLMSSRQGLRQNICDLPSSGTLRNEIEGWRVQQYLPPELRYACRYWVSHLRQSERNTCEYDELHGFLRKHALHWLEAMSIMGEASESIDALINLQSYINERGNAEFSDFVQDFKRFALWNRLLIEIAPLQLYSSALVFSPKNSITRKTYEKCGLKSIQLVSRSRDNWDALLQTLGNDSKSACSVAFSPNGKQLVSGSNNRDEIQLWDAATGSLQQTLEGHSDSVCSVVFSPNGRQLASGSNDGTIKLWDAVTGSLQQTLEGHPDSDSVCSVVFSPNGRQLASGFQKGTIEIWEAATGSLQQTLEDYSGPIYSIAFSPDGKQLASSPGDWYDDDGYEDKTIKLWETATWSLQQVFESYSFGVFSIAFLPDGKQLAAGCRDGTIKLWDIITGNLRQTFKSHSIWIWSLAFSPDSKQLASGGECGPIELWDAATENVQQTLKGHSRLVTSIAFSPNEGQLASCSQGSVNIDGTIKLWDVATGSLQQTFTDCSGSIWRLVFSPDGRQLMSYSNKSTIQLWDTMTGNLQQTLRGNLDSVAFSPDGRLLVSGFKDDEKGHGTIKLWDTATGSLWQTFRNYSCGVCSIAFSPDGKRLASGSENGSIDLWDAVTWNLRQTFKDHSDLILSLAFSPDNEQLICRSRDGIIQLWDAMTGSLRRTLENHSESLKSVRFSPNGKQLVSNYIEKRDIDEREVDYFPIIKLWDAATGRLQQTLEDTYINDVNPTPFSPDGRYLLTSNGLVTLQDDSKNSLFFNTQQIPNIFFQENWIMWDTQRIFLLPSEDHVFSLDFKGNLLALGHGSGRVTILKIDFSLLN